VFVDDARDFESVADLDAQLVAADDDRRARQAVESRGAVAAQLVLHQAGVGAGDEARDRYALAGEIAAHAGQAAVVLRELGHREAGVEVAEQRHELAAFDLEIKLVLRGGFEALLRVVTVQ
jgi:hypothetical protein